MILLDLWMHRAGVDNFRRLTKNWIALKRHVAISRRLVHMRTHPGFAAAIEAFDRGGQKYLLPNWRESTAATLIARSS